MGRPALTDDQVRARVRAYCDRYGVSPGPGGLPPFPSGRRESRQHREWLTAYRALRRFERRAAAQAAPDAAVACPLCARPIEPGLAVPYAARRTRSTRPALLHPSCAELARLADALGPHAVAALGPFLWPRHRLRPTSATRG
jgi:hypothetical protein